MRDAPEFELITHPILALSVLRLRLPPSLAPPPEAGATAAAEATNLLNSKLYAAASLANDKIFLTQTNLNGTVCIRFAVGAQRTERAHVEAAWALIRACATEVLSAKAGAVNGVGEKA